MANNITAAAVAATAAQPVVDSSGITYTFTLSAAALQKAEYCRTNGKPFQVWVVAPDEMDFPLHNDFLGLKDYSSMASTILINGSKTTYVS